MMVPDLHWKNVCSWDLESRRTHVSAKTVNYVFWYQRNTWSNENCNLIHTWVPSPWASVCLGSWPVRITLQQRWAAGGEASNASSATALITTWTTKSMENLCSMKPVPSAKKVGDCWSSTLNTDIFKTLHFLPGFFLHPQIQNLAA